MSLPSLAVIGTAIVRSGEQVVIATNMEALPAKRMLVVFTPEEAEWLSNTGRLTGL